MLFLADHRAPQQTGRRVCTRPGPVCVGPARRGISSAGLLIASEVPAGLDADKGWAFSSLLPKQAPCQPWGPGPEGPLFFSPVNACLASTLEIWGGGHQYGLKKKWGMPMKSSPRQGQAILLTLLSCILRHLHSTLNQTPKLCAFCS